MAVGKLDSRNTVQVIPDQSDGANPATIGVTPVVLYTCPANKKALVKTFLFRPTGFGAGTDMNANAAGVRLRTETATSLVMLDALGGREIVLNATETLTLDGDSAADNESAFWFITFQELPA